MPYSVNRRKISLARSRGWNSLYNTRLWRVSNRYMPLGVGVGWGWVLGFFILGCAIQCEQKEDFIDKIKGLELTVQHEIVERIKQVHTTGGWGGCSWVVGCTVDKTKVMTNNQNGF